MSNDKMREEFEECYLRDFLQIPKEMSKPIFVRDNRGNYIVRQTGIVYWAWQASREAMVIELPEEQPMYMYYAPDVLEAIEAAGVKVKA